MSSSSTADRNNRGAGPSDGNVGVQELIDRLKTEGVQEGQYQAETLLSEAKKQAAKIVDAARAEADTIVQEAQQQAERTETNGKRALALASRDASLQLREQLQHEFRGWIGRLVREQFDEPEFLAKLIREMAVQVMASVVGEPDTQDSDQTEKLKFLLAQNRAESI